MINAEFIDDVVATRSKGEMIARISGALPSAGGENLDKFTRVYLEWAADLGSSRAVVLRPRALQRLRTGVSASHGCAQDRDQPFLLEFAGSLQWCHLPLIGQRGICALVEQHLGHALVALTDSKHQRRGRSVAL